MVESTFAKDMKSHLLNKRRLRFLGYDDKLIKEIEKSGKFELVNRKILTYDYKFRKIFTIKQRVNLFLQAGKVFIEKLYPSIDKLINLGFTKADFGELIEKKNMSANSIHFIRSYVPKFFSLEEARIVLRSEHRNNFFVDIYNNIYLYIIMTLL